MGEEKRAAVAEVEESIEKVAKLDRLYCSTAERVVYIIKNSVAGFSMGNFDHGSSIYNYQILGLNPLKLVKAQGGLLIYDMINDPLSAAIVDNMRTRWGKFKPFQYLSLLPNLFLGLFNCLMPLIFLQFNITGGEKLVMFMISSYIGETIGAFFGGGGFIDLVFTPNPNERTSLLIAAKFVEDLYGKLPSQIVTVIFDLVDNGVIKMDIIRVYVILKTTIWALQTIPNTIWAIVSKERVPQSIKPPKATTSLASVFKNPPLLITTLSGSIDSINVGTDEALYYRNVLNISSFGMLFGLLGGPISYYSYILAPKFRRKFSTKTLWFFQRGSIFISEAVFFLVGMLGGTKGKFYSSIPIMGVTFMLGNCLEMVFYATKKIVGTEISYEVQDYCEWKNGFRVEATTGLLTNYINKVRNYLLKFVNAWILERWTGFESSALSSVQSEKTKFRLFIMAFGPRLIPDLISMIPMMFYNIDQKKRDIMYRDLQEARAKKAAEVSHEAEQESKPAE